MKHYPEQDLRDPELELMEDITATTTSLKRLTWKIEGVEREAYVYLPPASNSPAPLVIAFHGHGGRAIGWAPKIVLEKYWPKAIVCYAQGLPTPSPADREGQQSGWQHRVGEVDLHTHIIDKDIKFFDAMFDKFV
jgi:polyhydroxybutyrate depolymerase